jgi:pimeloyl-ACP methyl ester carboxylesterase
MRHNTTAHLIADMELLRAHLGIGRWPLYGYSWGSTLSLAYAERYPDRVSHGRSGTPSRVNCRQPPGIPAAQASGIPAVHASGGSATYAAGGPVYPAAVRA